MKPQVASLLARAVMGALPITAGILCTLWPTNDSWAASKFFVGVNGSVWNTTTSWSTTLDGASGAAVPVNGDDVTLDPPGAGTVTLLFNGNYTGVGLDSLRINGDSAFMFLSQTANNMIATTEIIGDTIGGNGYNQSGGTNTAELLVIGNGTGSSTGGTNIYNLGGTGVTTVSALFLVGNVGAGAFNQSGGTLNISSGLTIGNTTSGTFIGQGTVTISGGVVNTTVGLLSGNIVVGNVGNASAMVQTGGTINAGNSSLVVANGASSIATYTLGGGSLTDGTLTLGNSSGAIGNFVQTGGVHTVLNLLSLGASPGVIGNYSLSGGTLTSLSGPEFVGEFANGIFSQSGGTHNVNDNMIVGSGSPGLYQLSGASSFLNAAIETIDDMGTLTQTSGVNFANALNVGQTSTGGVYNISGGTLTIGSNMNAGYSSNSSAFNQTGGLVQFGTTGSFFAGLSAGSFCSVNISGGTFTTVTGYFGYAGNAAVTQTGGNVTSLGFTLSTLAGSNATYLLGGPGSPVLTTGTEIIGSGGFGLFVQQTGSIHTVSSYIALGYSTGALGIYDMNGGTLTAASITVSFFGNGTFNQSGGIVTITNNGIVGGGNGSAGTYNLSGGSLTLPAGSGNFLISPTGVFTQTGGSVSGYLTDNGLFTFSNGSFPGFLEITPQGTLNLTASNFFAGQGILNNGTLTVPLLISIGVAAGKTLDNENTIILNGGGFNGSGTVLNNGQITGFGTFAEPITNNGLITQGLGAISITNSVGVNNIGVITLAPGRQLQIISGGLTNGGQLQFDGAIVVGAGTLTNGAAGTIIGPGDIQSPFINTGTVAPGIGALTITPSWTNGGVIAPSGPASSLAGGAVTNTGLIQGDGTIASAVNNTTGTINPAGGALDFSGNLTNSATGTIRLTTGNQVFIMPAGSFAINAGLIDLAGGTFDNTTHTLSNTGQITGWGVLSTAGLTNNGSITLTGGTATVNGPVTNSAGKFINIKYQPALFTGDMNNLGTIKTTNTTVTFTGNYSGNAFISDPSTNIFQANVTIIAGGTMSGSTGDAFVFLGGTMSNAGNFSNGGLLQSADPTFNTGTFFQSGPQAWSPATVFTNSAGSASFLSDAGSPAASPLSINQTGGTVNFSSSEHINTLAISSGNLNLLAGVTKTNSLSLSHTGNTFSENVDLTTAKLVIESTTAADKLAKITDLNTAITSGSNGATWTGSGITSSVAAANNAHYGVGVFDNAILARTSFGGATDIDANSILLTIAHLGDANDDGVVDLQDLSIVTNNWQKSRNNWAQGDLNRDNIVDLGDLSIVTNNWQQTSSFTQTASPIAQSFATGATAVPEPGTLAALALLVPLVIRKRRSLENPTDYV